VRRLDPQWEAERERSNRLLRTWFEREQGREFHATINPRNRREKESETVVLKETSELDAGACREASLGEEAERTGTGTVVSLKSRRR
jgi:hypothetical protein